MQRLHLVSLLGPGLEGGFAPVASYGFGHDGRFAQDLGRAPRCRLILVRAPHVYGAPSVRVRSTPLLWRRLWGGASTKGMIPSGTFDLFTMHINALRR